jgi:hypothetical protein
VAFNTPPEEVGPVAALLAQVKPLRGQITGILFGRFDPAGGSQYERIALCGCREETDYALRPNPD